MPILDKVTGLFRPRRMTPEEYMEKMIRKGVGPDGHFVPSDEPMEPPIGYVRQPSLAELVREAVMSEKLRAAAEEAGLETFEESEDFDVPDEPELLRSRWENEFDPPLAEITAAVQEDQEKKAQSGKKRRSTAKQSKGAADDDVDPPSDGPGIPELGDAEPSE